MTRSALLLVFLVPLAGCGPVDPPVYPAAGKVVFRSGQPVSGGVVEFRPEAGGPAARGKIEADGRFTLTTGARSGAVAGAHKVTIVQMVLADGAARHVAAGHGKAASIHPKYASADKSGLTRTVEPTAANEFVIEVDSASDKRGW
jgi:hypothetical protein